MTGGLASTVAAFLLKGQGLEVLGASLQFLKSGGEGSDRGGTDWQELLKSFRRSCHVDDLEEVKSICEELEIPLYAVNLEEEFQHRVLDQLIASRLQGAFFSSCMECHKIKLRILQEKAKKLDCQYIATGHFAKVHHDAESGGMDIHAFDDGGCDQSHLLSGVEKKLPE